LEELHPRLSLRQKIDFEFSDRKRLLHHFGRDADGSLRTDRAIAVLSVLVGIPQIRVTANAKRSPAQVLGGEIKAIRSARQVLQRVETAPP